MDEVRCPLCGTPTKIRAGRRYCPRCDYWKTSYGEAHWEKHATNVQGLVGELRVKFPQATWEVGGLGAATGARLDIPPQRKGEPDIRGWWMRKHFVSIEVSGTDSPNVSVPPGPIFIRPGKVTEAEAQGVPYFFYLVYPNATYVVDLSLAQAHRRNSVPRKIRGRVETYIAIPHEKAYFPSFLFASIAALLGQLEPQGRQGKLL